MRMICRFSIGLLRLMNAGNVRMEFLSLKRQQPFGCCSSSSSSRGEVEAEVVVALVVLAGCCAIAASARAGSTIRSPRAARADPRRVVPAAVRERVGSVGSNAGRRP